MDVVANYDLNAGVVVGNGTSGGPYNQYFAPDNLLQQEFDPIAAWSDVGTIVDMIPNGNAEGDLVIIKKPASTTYGTGIFGADFANDGNGNALYWAISQYDVQQSENDKSGL